MALHLDRGLRPASFARALRQHPADREILLARDLLQRLLEGLQIVARAPVDVDDDGVGLHRFAEHEPGLRHVYALQRDMVPHGGLVWNLVEDAETELQKAMRDELVLVLNRQLNFNTFPVPAHRQPLALAHTRVEGGVPEHEVCAWRPIELQQDIAWLQEVGRGGARDAMLDLQHAARGRLFAEGATNSRRRAEELALDESAVDTETKHLWE
mmetsp:Transcript_124145/g.356613  ORF Transcript_124145/g.356613 Transcript_124145/m.356613 type:complete len:212 (-) Transcript_124145:775-1410(-)